MLDFIVYFWLICWILSCEFVG